MPSTPFSGVRISWLISRRNCRAAAFGGGNVDIRTRTIPEELTAYVQVGTGWNADSSDDGLSYSGGGADRWGRDDGTRALPGQISQAIQDYQASFSSASPDIYLTKQERAAVRRAVGRRGVYTISTTRTELDTDTPAVHRRYWAAAPSEEIDPYREGWPG
jgi:hypothetical protein